MGAAVPRAAAHPGGPGSAPRNSPTSIPALAELLGKIADGIAVEGMEALAPVLVDRMELLLDHVPLGGVVLVCDPERVRTRAVELVAHQPGVPGGVLGGAAVGGEAPVDLGGAAFQPIARIREAAADLGVPWWTLAPFGVTSTRSRR